MFKRLVQKLQGLRTEPVGYDPSLLDDPVATQTDWTPAKGGGASFRTHKLVEVNSFRLEFRAAMGLKVFSLIFLLVGVGVMVAFWPSNLLSGALSVERTIPMLIGLVFAGVGGSLHYFGTAPIVFDKRRGAFWKGRKAPYEVVNKKALKHYALLEDIHALQLISEHCRSDDSSYYSYELNLVLEDGRRINVVDHGKQSDLQGDAGTLAAFLEKPVWDAT